MQYTIEERELTSEYTHRPSFDGESSRIVIDAADPDEAISRYIRERDAELISFMSPGRSRESIATVKKEDCVFLVRVYAALSRHSRGAERRRGEAAMKSGRKLHTIRAS